MRVTESSARNKPSTLLLNKTVIQGCQFTNFNFLYSMITVKLVETTFSRNTFLTDINLKVFILEKPVTIDRFQLVENNGANTTLFKGYG